MKWNSAIDIGDSPQNIIGTKKKYSQRLSGNHLFVIYLNLLTILIVLSRTIFQHFGSIQWSLEKAGLSKKSCR